MSTAADFATCRALGLHIDMPPEEWPDVESAAMVFVIADRQRTGARNLLRQFIGRPALRRVMRELAGRFVVLACARHGRVSASDAGDLAELLEVHRDVLTLSRIVSGHVEVFHALDAETRAAILEDGASHALRSAAIGGRA